jgi:RNA polymerase sigma-70 factor, ECF subfamily
MYKTTQANSSVTDRHGHTDRFVRETEPVREFLIRNATRLTRQRADAEDLVQETLLKAYVSFGSYRDGTQLSAWLSRIMANAWIDKHRSAQRRPTEQLSAEVADPPVGGDAVHANSPTRVESAETEALRAFPGDAEMALRLLPDELRAIVYYAYIGGYRNTEIAALLNIPAGTVGSRLHRGKALLRAALTNPRGGDPFPAQ